MLLRAHAVQATPDPTTKKKALRFGQKPAPLQLQSLSETLRLSTKGIRECVEVSARRQRFARIATTLLRFLAAEVLAALCLSPSLIAGNLFGIGDKFPCRISLVCPWFEPNALSAMATKLSIPLRRVPE